MERTNKLSVVFLDRDGTIIVDKVYLNDPDGVEFIEGVKEGLQKLNSLGFKFILVTNQSGIARGLVRLENLELIHKKIREELSLNGVDIFKIYYCPHLPEDNCNCRKPKVGMVEKDVLNLIDKKTSFMIGDKETDVEFGKSLGIKSILITKDKNINTQADYVVSNFKDAVDIIIKCVNSF
ncbi:MAG: HAD family hydrolase [Endomicrobia bacterium]|nr:HAD family hydrolase [Endomicrobiia bacterium]